MAHQPRRCPLCRVRAAETVVELGLVHVKVCAPCSSNFYTAFKVFNVLKGFLKPSSPPGRT